MKTLNEEAKQAMRLARFNLAYPMKQVLQHLDLSKPFSVFTGRDPFQNVAYGNVYPMHGTTLGSIVKRCSKEMLNVLNCGWDAWQFHDDGIETFYSDSIIESTSGHWERNVQHIKFSHAVVISYRIQNADLPIAVMQEAHLICGVNFRK